jgi:hypothetical protein
MLLSSRCSERWREWLLVGAAVSEHGPEDGDAAPGEGDEGLLVVLTLGAFAFVERA